MARDTDSRAAILDAAESLFARQGYDATTIKEIAGTAKLNSALIYYYFGDKHGLYHGVLERFATELVGNATKALDAARTPEEAVQAIVATQSSMLSSHPYRARLIARELVDHEAAHAQPLITQLATRVFSRLCSAIEKGQRAGTFRRDLDAQFAAISVVSQVVYFHIARPAVQVLLKSRGGVSEATERAFAGHAGAFALAGLGGSPPIARGPVRSTRKRKPK